MNNREIKDKAKLYFSNNKSQILKACFHFYLFLIIMLAVLLFIGYKLLGDYLTDYYIVFFGIYSLIIAPLFIGFNKSLRNVTIEQKLFNKSDLFYFYSPKSIFSVMAGLAVIIGINYLGIKFSFIFNILYFAFFGLLQYVIADMKVEEITSRNFFKESIQLLNGHRYEYFMLLVSFIWLLLLVIVTCGFGIFYALPVIKISKIIFVENIDGDDLIIEKY